MCLSLGFDVELEDLLVPGVTAVALEVYALGAVGGVLAMRFAAGGPGEDLVVAADAATEDTSAHFGDSIG